MLHAAPSNDEQTPETCMAICLLARQRQLHLGGSLTLQVADVRQDASLLSSPSPDLLPVLRDVCSQWSIWHSDSLHTLLHGERATASS